MKISQLAKALGYEVLTKNHKDRDIADGYTSDLLSDILANAAENAVIITIQAHKNTAAVAYQVGAPAVLICNNRQVPGDMLAAMENEGIAVLRTGDNQFTASRKVFGQISGKNS
jgi:hypothetical protein